MEGELTRQEWLMRNVVDASVTVIKTLGYGFLESVYQRALARELRLRGVKCDLERPIDVAYKGEIVGAYRADILVENEIIVETKVSDDISLAHEIQVVNYLKATGLECGVIINFGTYPLGVKRKFKDKPAKLKR